MRSIAHRVSAVITARIKSSYFEVIVDEYLTIVKWLGTVLISAVISLVLRYYVIRPKLKVIGGGSSTEMGYSTNTIRIRNVPNLLGIKFQETVIFGKKIHGDKEIGLDIDRNPASECIAYLYDKKANQIISTLLWATNDDPNSREQIITLKNGESADLIIFSRLLNEPLKYFVYQPESTENNRPRIPDDEIKFNSTMEFVIIVYYSSRKQSLKINCRMIRSHDGKLTFEFMSGRSVF